MGDFFGFDLILFGKKFAKFCFLLGFLF